MVIFRRAFWVTLVVIQCMDVRRWQWFSGTRTRLGIKEGERFPVMGCEKASNVGGTRYLDGGTGLEDVNAIEAGNKSELFERRGFFAMEL
jgi:hypothetical protein